MKTLLDILCIAVALAVAGVAYDQQWYLMWSWDDFNILWKNLPHKN